MTARNDYTPFAKFSHWLTFLLLLGSFGVGFYMGELALSPLKVKLINYHKWIGVTVFSLVLLRLLWRFTHRPPELPGAMRPWEQQVARITHWALYALLFAVPLSGWMMSSAKGFQTVYFGVLPIPDLAPKNAELGELLEQFHGLLAFSLLLLVGLHIAAAFKHHFINRDSVLRRMLPRLGSHNDRTLP